MLKQTVVRTYPAKFDRPTQALREKLNEGWIVKHINEIRLSTGETDCLEYILQKDVI